MNLLDYTFRNTKYYSLELNISRFYPNVFCSLFFICFPIVSTRTLYLVSKIIISRKLHHCENDVINRICYNHNLLRDL